MKKTLEVVVNDDVTTIRKDSGLGDVDRNVSIQTRDLLETSAANKGRLADRRRAANKPYGTFQAQPRRALDWKPGSGRPRSSR